METPALALHGVCKRYPGFTLQEVSFTLPRGYIMGLIGPNGAGKTTIIRLIMNLARPDAGRITVLGRDSRADELALRRRIGYVGEYQPFYDELTVEWTAAFVRSYYPDWDEGLFGELLAKYGIERKKKIGALSKGTRLKFALALALAHRPELLLLDEPTSGLDPVIRRELLVELKAFIRDETRSVLFSSHQTQDLEQIADYVTLIHDGRIIESAEKDELLARYRKMGAANIDEILLAVIRRGDLKCGG
ncbi:MAG: ABC transporter ATP-binding protein [Bacillota bacterium]